MWSFSRRFSNWSNFFSKLAVISRPGFFAFINSRDLTRPQRNRCIKTIRAAMQQRFLPLTEWIKTPWQSEWAFQTKVQIPLVTSSTRSTGYKRAVSDLLNSYCKFLPSESMIFDAFFLIKVLNVVRSTIYHMSDFIYPQELKVLLKQVTYKREGHLPPRKWHLRGRNHP